LSLWRLAFNFLITITTPLSLNLHFYDINQKLKKGEGILGNYTHRCIGCVTN